MVSVQHSAFLIVGARQIFLMLWPIAEVWQTQSIVLRHIGENYQHLLCDENSLRVAGLKLKQKKFKLKNKLMTRRETPVRVEGLGFVQAFKKWFLHLLYIVRTPYLAEELVWLINVILISRVLLISALFEWNLTCQQGVLNIVCKEPYGSQLKESTPGHLTTELFQLTKEP